MIGDFTRLLHAGGIEITESKVTPESLHALLALLDSKTITVTIAKSVFEEMFSSGHEPAAIIKQLGLEPISGSDEIDAVCARVIEANPKAVTDYRAGKQEAVKFLVGQAMRETRGRANAETLSEMLRRKLDSNI
jgi:aspartyl-tRNA(Asn)/glutamyl-tRNA(Gln) amidotransferase subunit B